MFHMFVRFFRHSLHSIWDSPTSQMIFYNLQTLRFALYSVGFGKCTVSCISYYYIIQNSFTILKVHCALPIQPSTLPKPLATTDLFLISVILPFLEYHVNVIIQYVAFSEWPLLFIKMHLRVIRVFVMVTSFFSEIVWIFHYVDDYAFTCWDYFQFLSIISKLL